MKARITSAVAALATLFVCLLPLPALAALGDCGQPQSAGASPTATDALTVLKSAVGLASSCDTTPCICDVGGDGNVTSTYRCCKRPSGRRSRSIVIAAAPA